jgi:hypothetical protein
MILFDRKKALNQIMGPPQKKSEGGEVNPAHEIAKEAIEAVHAKDHEGFANASKALFMHFQSDPDQDDDKHESDTGREE